MVAVNHRVVNTVINRCKMPSDGDILVPAHTVAVMGTTDTKVSDPDHFGIEPWGAADAGEGEKMLPGFGASACCGPGRGAAAVQETVTTKGGRTRPALLQWKATGM
jgi:glycerol-3-phosphate dehydrogenase